MRQAQTCSSPLHPHTVSLMVALPFAVVSADRGHDEQTHWPDLQAHSLTSPLQPHVVVWISATIILVLVMCLGLVCRVTWCQLLDWLVGDREWCESRSSDLGGSTSVVLDDWLFGRMRASL